MITPLERALLKSRVMAPRSILSLLALAITLAAAPAAAQGTIGVLYSDLDGRGQMPIFDPNVTGGRPLNAEECTSNAEITFTLSNIRTDASGVMAIWRGAPTAACETAAARMAPSGGGTSPCTALGISEMIITGSQTITVTAGVADLFGTDQCSGVSQSQQGFWFLMLTDATATTPDVPVADYARVTIFLDTDAPDAPLLSGSFAGGDTVAIDVDTDGQAGVTGAAVYVDSSAAAAASCPEMPTSTTLIPGAAAPGTAAAREYASFTVSPSATALGLDNVGEYAVVAATLLDAARNESVLSELACVQRVQVIGFWDTYCMDRGFPADADGIRRCREQYAGCAVSRSSRPALPTLVLFALVAVAIGFRRRR